MEIELRHLRAFVAVAGSRSSTRAAERLFITQPALTRTIRQLESPLSPVSLAFRPGVREPLLRSFVQAALAAVDLGDDGP